MSKKILIIISVVAILLGFFIYRKTTEGISVNTTTVKRGEVKQIVSASGEVTSENYGDFSFPLSSKITAIKVKEGQEVKKGQELIKADLINEYNTYLQSLASLEQAKSSLNTFKEQYKVNPDAISVYNDKIYWDKYNYYNSAVDQAQSQINIALKALGDKTIRAPFDGIVTKIFYKEGEITSPASPVVSMTNQSQLFFLAEIDESDFGKIKEKQKAKIDLDSFPDQSFTGEIYELVKFASKNSSGNSVFKIKISLPDNIKPNITIGMKGDTEITTVALGNVLYLDSSAIFTENDKYFVFYEQGGKVVKKEVQVGLKTDLDTEIISGINEKEKVIFPKNGTIKEGIKVKIAK